MVLNYIYHINAQSPATGEMGFQILTQSLGWAKRPLIDRIFLLLYFYVSFILYHL